MSQEKRPGALRNALTWFGAGLVTGALLWLIVVASLYGGGAFSGSFWWVVSALAGVLALVLVVKRRDDTGYVLRMIPLAVVGSSVAVLTFPRDSFEATTRDAWAFSPSPTEVHLWVATCAIGLGCALLLFCLRRPDPRPLLRSLPFAGTGALTVALTGTLVGTVLLPWVPHQVADDLADPAPIPANITRVGWEWRPPMGAEVTDVFPGSHGPLILLRDGAVALDGTDGAELWSYRHPYDPVDDVWVHEENVHVRHQVGTDDSGEDLFEIVALDSTTGEVLDEDSDAVQPLGGGVREHGRELLAEALDLPEAPLRIECFDISNLQGEHVVASMVVFEDGLARKSEYRRFSIRGSGEGGSELHDVAAMYEVVRRRFRRYLEESSKAGELARMGETGDHGAQQEATEGEPTPGKFAYPPNLVVVDGARPQAEAARRALDELGIEDVAVCGLAKRLEEVWLPDDEDPVILPRNGEGLYLLQRVRDEAHRFAIRYHRQKRAKALTGSSLDELPGLGPSRRSALIKEFGSVKRLAEAGVEDIAAVPGIGAKLAEAVHAHLSGGATAEQSTDGGGGK